ncbi:MAG: peptide chain release factor N(5)-glutamine methyltransferase [Symploca sp. SIO1B1]|nr:peptide chain release factor N(5)-glutamine methyltransferase [Symploca sp. SIO1C2]NER94792.1 peptide chain release factor N(5)-glutamine methyltransferase [Symploca sp. SIO1B1]
MTHKFGKLSLVSGLELWQWRLAAGKAALEAGIPLEEVDWLLQEVAGLDPLTIRLESFKERSACSSASLSQIELQLPLQELSQLWERRLQERLPVQYLTGVTHWRHFALTVAPAVLIPRPETECLIDLALEAVNNSPTPQLDFGHWADLGTGSGAIALGLAEALTNASIYAVDCSQSALAIAQQNTQRLSYSQRIQFYQGSWWEPLEDLKGTFSGMVANPPYIPSNLLPQLQPEVVNHEPHLALDGGNDGLDCIRKLITTSADYLQPGGIWLIEMMAGQAATVVELLHQQGSYSQIKIFPDLAGIDRFALAYRV